MVYTNKRLYLNQVQSRARRVRQYEFGRYSKPHRVEFKFQVPFSERLAAAMSMVYKMSN